MAGDLKKITEVEKKIVEARCSGDSFSELTEDDKVIVSAQIIAIGSALTGGQTPTTDFFMNILRNEVHNFILNFGYADLTEQEIYLALRLNAEFKIKLPSGVYLEKIQFSGSYFNVEFLSKILHNYSVLRTHLERRLENMVNGHE